MSVVKGKLIPLNDNVLVSDMSFEEQRTATGIYIPSDDGKSEGIKPRWGKVWAIGPKQQDVKLGEWILIEHGRWTRGVTVQDENGDETVIRRVDTKSILASADEKPGGVYFGDYTKPEHGSVHNPQDFINV
jgi:co-chaperonin GroES (HSP10)